MSAHRLSSETGTQICCRVLTLLRLYMFVSFFREHFFIMGRMHAPGKGISRRALPYKRTPPSWLKMTAADVEENVCKLQNDESRARVESGCAKQLASPCFGNNPPHVHGPNSHLLTIR